MRIIIFMISVLCMSEFTLFPAARPSEKREHHSNVFTATLGQDTKELLSDLTLHTSVIKTSGPVLETPFLLPGQDHEMFKEYGGVAGFCEEIELRRKNFEDEDLGLEEAKEFQTEDHGFYHVQDEKKTTLLRELVYSIEQSDSKEFFRIAEHIERGDARKNIMKHFANIEVGGCDFKRCPYYSIYSLSQLAFIAWCKLLEQATEVSKDRLGDARNIALNLLLEDFDYNKSFEIIGLKCIDDFTEIRLIDLIKKYGLGSEILLLLPTACEDENRPLVEFLWPMTHTLVCAPGRKEELYRDCVYNAVTKNKSHEVLEYLFTQPEICSSECLRRVIEYALVVDRDEKDVGEKRYKIVVDTVIRFFMYYNYNSYTISISDVTRKLLGDFVRAYCAPREDVSKDKLLGVIDLLLRNAINVNLISPVTLQQVFLAAQERAGTATSSDCIKALGVLFRKYCIVN